MVQTKRLNWNKRNANVSEACAPARQQNPTNTKTCKLPTDIVQAREEQTLLRQITFL